MDKSMQGVFPCGSLKTKKASAEPQMYITITKSILFANYLNSVRLEHCLDFTNKQTNKNNKIK
jgi:hypothetical protein